MYTINITKQMISQEICEELCGMAERNQERTFKPSDKFVLIRNWNDKGPLTVTYEIVLQGYHCYQTSRIPAFISKNWEISFEIYKRLKGL